MHSRPIGIEDSCDLDAETMLAVIVEEQRLRATLALVIAGSGPYRINISPVVLGLRMYRGISVNFTGGGLEDTALETLGEPQHVDGSMHRRLSRLHRIMLIVDR
jgi:hypothetical protein